MTLFSRTCCICQTYLQPYTPDIMTAHEYNCYLKDETKIPETHRKAFENEKARQIRSARAKKAALKRKA